LFLFLDGRVLHGRGQVAEQGGHLSVHPDPIDPEEDDNQRRGEKDQDAQ